jgi:glycosyltransferase involved in cell wall biosynthesis
MIDVAFLGRFGTCCGVSTYTEQLAEQLVAGGSSVVAAASTHGHTECGPHRTDCVEGIRTIPCWGEDGDFDEAFRVIDGLRPRLVHIQHEHGIFRNRRALIDLVGRLSQNGIKTVLTAHTVPANAEAPMLALVMSVDGVIVHSSRAKRVLQDQFACLKIADPTPVRHIAHGMLPPQQKAGRAYSRTSLAIPMDDSTVVALALGFISRTKKHMFMLQALEAINSRSMCHPKKLFLIIAGMPDPNGGDELIRLLRQMAKRSGIEDRLLIIPEFIPFDLLPVLYGAADLCVHVRGASQLSSSGSIRQDLSYGMPVITQRSELTEDLPNDAVMFFSGEQGLLSMLPTLVRNGGLRKRLEEHATLMARKHEWRRTAAHHMRFYEDVAQAPMINRKGALKLALELANQWLRRYS